MTPDEWRDGMDHEAQAVRPEDEGWARDTLASARLIPHRTVLVDVLLSVATVGVAAFTLSGLSAALLRLVADQEPVWVVLTLLNLSTAGVLALLGLSLGAARVRVWTLGTAFLIYPLAWAGAQGALGNTVGWDAPLSDVLLAGGAVVLSVLAGALAGRAVTARRLRRA
ncbi:hypothetical protein [Deinococcus sp. JMULE3]|uniref:hypothetical protein n=1 Tax=Deinococcus sp. JMULE3 TaxID=2518341 RepID=UPI0015768F1B|nr:hypothetical protein [Deinococcus sp. JMULE3]NTY02278.1 hypothetical protein [Deinococcus sp. JMULE3]